MHILGPALLAASLMLATTGGALAVGLPPPSNLPATQPVPSPHPYDTAAARRSGRDVLIDFGANWCPDCRMLNGVMQMPAVRAWRDSRFETVMVNVDRFNVNMDVAARYGVTVKQIPTVLVLTPQGKLLDPDGTLALGNARAMSPQASVDQIAAWDARPH